MKRRKAIKNIVFYSIGTSLLLSCDNPFSAVYDLQLDKLVFEKEHLKLIDDFSRVILPIQNIEELNAHTTLPFVMQSVNDLYNIEKRALFTKGYTTFDSYFERNFSKSWKDANQDEKMTIVNQLNTMKAKPWKEVQATKDVIKYFFDVLKKENLQYLRTCEYIQRNIRLYEMAPDRYNGSFLVSELKAKHKSSYGE